MAEGSSRPRVWVADDTPRDATLAQDILGEEYEIRLFSDGAAVLESLGSGAAPDVLVVDWVMPAVSGLEVARFLQEQHADGTGPAVLVMTARREPEDLEEAFAAGADDYVTKPYNAPELRARVAALVRQRALVRRAETAEEAYRALYEGAPDALLTVDDADRITAANEQAEICFAEGGSNLEGRSIREILPAAAWDDLKATAAVEGPAPDVRIEDRTFSPTVRRLGRGQVSIALRNVTRERRASQRRLDLYSIIAHDLRTPLAGILLRTDVILGGGRGLLSAALVADIQRIADRIRSLVSMTNDFLQLARLEEGAYQMRREPLELDRLVAQVVDDFSSLALAEGVDLGAEVEPGSALVGDPERLVQALTNLVGNAVKFTPSGGRVRVHSRRDGRQIELSVEDTGPGIPRDLQPIIFERYVQAEEADRAGGSGLGLMIVREIVEAHQGTVGVESEPGRGSRFWMRFPAEARRGAEDRPPVAP